MVRLGKEVISAVLFTLPGQRCEKISHCYVTAQNFLESSSKRQRTKTL